MPQNVKVNYSTENIKVNFHPVFGNETGKWSGKETMRNTLGTRPLLNVVAVERRRSTPNYHLVGLLKALK